jgi:TIGR03009 family protein
LTASVLAGAAAWSQGQYPQAPAVGNTESPGDERGDHSATTQISLEPPVPAEPSQAASPTVLENQPLPSPFPAISPEDQARLASLLGFWEAQSNKVRTFDCQFDRLTYDSVFGPPNDPLWVAQGQIRYASPDKGEFRIERIARYVAPKETGAKAEYQWHETESLEHWICDGESVFELNSNQKQLIERRLPSEMRGKDIADGPLPFIFGASRAKIDARYWIREVIPPKERAGEYCFEAYPKRREDAASFQRVRIILAANSFLPSAMEVFPPSFDGVRNLSREVYRFRDPQVNTISQKTREFLDQFISPRVPLGWKKIVQNFDEPASAAPAQAAQRSEMGLPRVPSPR